ncbi:DNA damage-regulated autophagy modulator protein 2-like [Cylas formicarius]|uniref:DNA damage-regulated autophagy modulator protein 2-like n=1 Tax=Cylas formicarius TaxID=197179 RepID=UPI0029588079|nr:DNA damage-regulated autophagy modulator protein 2-like [Cylas formicarius]
MFLPACLPVAIFVLTAVTTSITFYLSAIYTDHVNYTLPYISDTGTYPPESCIFGQLLNIISVLVGFVMYIKFRQVKEIFEKHHIDEQLNINEIGLFVGILAAFGISVVANFQETNVFVVHWIGAILTFGCGSVYCSLQTLLYIKISPVIGQRKLTLFRIILSLVSFVTFLVFTITGFMAYAEFKGDDVTKWTKEDGGFDIHQISTNTEWICAGCTMIYILLLVQEFRKITVRPLTVVLEPPTLCDAHPT